MTVAIEGFMGSGKSCVGKELSRILSFGFIDLDEVICAHSHSDIPTIFSTLGEEGFRRLETEELRNILQTRKDDLVLSLGGGSPVTNAELIKKNCMVIYLSISEETMLSRLQAGEMSKRPMMLRGSVHELFRKRLELYESISDITIDCNGRTIEECARLCAQALRRIQQESK